MLRHHLIIFIVITNILYLCVKSERTSSLTFVIDDSGSMSDDIDAVRKGAKGIMDVVLQHKASQIEDIVLVTFNDPENLTSLRNKTIDPETLQKALNSINAHNDGNFDWPEYALSGVKLALEESQPRSHLYIFTDASAKDYQNAETVISLCQKKQSRTVFVLTDYCLSYYDEKCLVYHNIAHACSGQVFILDKTELNQVISFVKETIQGETDIITSKIIPPNVATRVQFITDEKTEYAIISVSGIDIQILNFYGPSKDYIYTVSSNNVKVIKLIRPTPGAYAITVLGYSQVSVNIFGRTDFSFRHGFSEYIPKSMKDVNPQTIEGTDTYLSTFIIDPDHEINIQSAQILSMNEDVVYDLPLKKVSGDFYITNKFISPNYMFKVKVMGTVISTGKSISRMAKTPVKPKPKPIKNKPPVAHIREGTDIELDYGSDLQLNCDVNAYPQPIIRWKNDLGVILNGQTFAVELPYEYSSLLNLTNIKTGRKFFCLANNRYGDMFTSISVTVQNALTVSTPEAAVNAVYGKDITIDCHIRSNLPIKIKWFHILDEGKSAQINSSRTYLISSDGLKLKIRSIDLGFDGKYKCVAHLKDDETQTATYSTNVKITGLTPPKIYGSVKIIDVKENTPFNLSCRAVGTPTPNLDWTFQKFGSNQQQQETLQKHDEVLHFSNAVVNQTGKYTCVAKNALGVDVSTLELNVNKSPVSYIVEGSAKNVSYRGNLSLSCKVLAHPRPSITWYNSKGVVKEYASKITEINKQDFVYVSTIQIYNIENSDKYYCNAENNYGKMISDVDVTTLSPFTIHNTMQKSTDAKFGKEVPLICDIKSPWPMKIEWFFSKTCMDVFKPITNSNKYSLSVDGTKLKIKYMDLRLEGKYMCKATLRQDTSKSVTYYTDVRVIDLVVPIIEDSTNVKVITVRVNTSASMLCKILNGNPPPKISWSYQKIDTNTMTKLSVATDEVHINKSKLEDAGVYTCIAENVAGRAVKKYQLVIEAPPIIVLDNNMNMFEAVEGDLVLKMPCNAVGYPKPTVKWFYDGIRDRHTIVDGALVIKNPKALLDTKMYTCIANNKLGNATQIFEGIVNPDLTFETNFGDSKNIYILKGTTNKIECLLNYTGTDLIKWYMNGQDTNITGLHYTIKNASEFHDANYTCRVSNSNGSISETYNVDVGYPPKLKYPDSTPIYWEGDHDQIVNCDVESKPRPKTEWVFNGVHVENAHSTQLSIIGIGNYSCLVKNVHGFINNNIVVTTKVCLINRNETVSSNMPLMLTNELQWPKFKTQKEFIVINPTESVTLTCNNNVNQELNSFITHPKQENIIATCDKNNKFLVGEKEYAFVDLKCKNELSPTVVKTTSKCLHENTQIIKVGFNVTKFVEVYSVCYDTEKYLPIYSKVNISMYNDFARDANEIKWYKYPGIGDGVSERLYTCKDSTSTSCYSKNQLISYKDVSYGVGQKSTYIEHLNEIPYWRHGNITRMTWDDLEKYVKSLMFSYEYLEVISGGNNYEIKNGLLVPRYLWKVLRFDDSDALALIYVNDPSPTDTDIKCSTECPDVSLNEDDPFTYCCDIDEFTKSFGINLLL